MVGCMFPKPGVAWSNLWQFAVDEGDQPLTFEGVCTAERTDGRNSRRAAGNEPRNEPAGGRADGRTAQESPANGTRSYPPRSLREHIYRRHPGAPSRSVYNPNFNPSKCDCSQLGRLHTLISEICGANLSVTRASTHLSYVLAYVN